MDKFSKKDNAEKDTSNKKIDLQSIKDLGKNKTTKVKYLAQKDMNFYERYETVVEGKQAKVNPMFFIAPAAGVLGALVAIVVIINVMTVITVRGNKNIQEFVDDSNNVATYNQAIKLSDDIANKKSSKSALDQTLELMKKYPQINQEFFGSIYGAMPQSVTIESAIFESAQGYFSMSCKTTDIKAIPSFINNLEATGKFAYTSYKGYNGGQGGYAFTVDCICNGN
ncbi:MAG: hypothetical protein RR911_03260 [Oscillospiraceae bacterium]